MRVTCPHCRKQHEVFIIVTGSGGTGGVSPQPLQTTVPMREFAYHVGSARLVVRLDATFSGAKPTGYAVTRGRSDASPGEMTTIHYGDGESLMKGYDEAVDAFNYAVRLML